MTCIHTVSYVVVVNGQPVGRILPAREIRQGDPLSPYLFLVCTEALGSLFHHIDLSSCISRVLTSNGALALAIYSLQMIVCYLQGQLCGMA